MDILVFSDYQINIVRWSFKRHFYAYLILLDQFYMNCIDLNSCT